MEMLAELFELSKLLEFFIEFWTIGIRSGCIVLFIAKDISDRKHIQDGSINVLADDDQLLF